MMIMLTVAVSIFLARDGVCGPLYQQVDGFCVPNNRTVIEKVDGQCPFRSQPVGNSCVRL
jgi:hypothetical protein